MKIFKLGNSIKRKEIGRLPQCEDSNFQGDRFGEDCFADQGKYGPVVGNPTLPEPILHKSSKPTDYLGIVALSNFKYNIITPRFYAFLKPYLRAHQTWAIKVNNSEIRFDMRKLKYVIKDETKLKKYDYLILHLSYSSHRLVNYPECEFFIDFRDVYMKNVYDLPTYVKKDKKDLKKIYSHEEYIQYVTYLGYHEERKKILVLKKLVLNLSENKEEIFRIMTPMNNLAGYYVTEKLKKKIEVEGFTGMAFKPLEELNPHVEIEIR